MKKILVYSLIVLGILVWIKPTAVEAGTCTFTPRGENKSMIVPANNNTDCEKLAKGTGAPTSSYTTEVTPKNDSSLSPFAKEVERQSCSIFNLEWGCFAKLFYWTLYTPATMLLYVGAQFFNVLLYISLNNSLLEQGFVSTAWAVIRDISNIFFIIALLYVAFKIILNDAGHGVKQMIGKIVVMALLINFSMFFAKVVIDSSNVLALIFYSKLNVTTKNGTEVKNYTGISSPNEKDISGAMYYAFDPTKTLSSKFFEDAKIVNIPGYAPSTSSEVPPGVLISMTLMAAAIMLVAAYCFFASGLAFMTRLIELFVLIIFSPFAFMSFAVPWLAGQEYIGWNSWLKQLLKTAFMAPIFMFLMYFIFMLLRGETLFSSLIKSDGRTISTILSVVVPAAIILGLLMRATSFAKKSSGKVGEVISKGVSKTVGMATGLALGVASGGTSLALTGTVGALASRAASSKLLGDNVNKRGFSGWAARKAIQASDYTSKASFDIRKLKPVNTALGKAGVNTKSLNGIVETSGGFEGRVERKAKDLARESLLVKTRMSDTEVKTWSAQRITEYEDAHRQDKEKKKADLGDKWDENKYDEENHKPKAYSTAAELNKDRLHQFESNLGIQGLMGSLVFSALQGAGKTVTEENWKTSDKYAEKFRKHNPGKELAFDHHVADDVNKEAVKSVKLKVGVGAGLVAGLATGGLAAGFVGPGAGFAAAGLTTVGGLGSAATTAAAEKKFVRDHKKEYKNIDDIESRLQDVAAALAAFDKRAELINNLSPETITKKDGKIVIDSEKLEDKIAEFQHTIQRNTETEKELAKDFNENDPKFKNYTPDQITALKKDQEEKLVKIRRESIDAMKNVSILSRGRDAVDDYRKIRDQQYKLNRDASKENQKIDDHNKHLMEKNKAKGGGGDTEHKKEEPTHPEPAHPEKDHGSGDDHHKK